MNASATLMLRALDGYSPTLSLADARRYRMIVALAMDGVSMSVGGLGPLWAVYDADRLPDFKDKPLDQRFAFCPWALYYVEVSAREVGRAPHHATGSTRYSAASSA